MAVTPFQSGILRSLADQRRRRGESYVAGGVALNELLAAPRRSRDIDLFHDSETALAATWEADGEALRNDDNFCYVAACENAREGKTPELNKEPLKLPAGSSTT